MNRFHRWCLNPALSAWRTEKGRQPLFLIGIPSGLNEKSGRKEPCPKSSMFGVDSHLRWELLSLLVQSPAVRDPANCGFLEREK